MARLKVDDLDYKDTFRRDYKKAPPEIQRELESVLDDLRKYPQSGKLRFHSLTGCFNPKIFKVDVLPNKSWQITFEMDGNTAVLRRLGRHKDIDRAP